MNELKLLEEFLELIQNIKEEINELPSLLNYSGQEYPAEHKVIIRSLVDEIHELLDEIPEQKENQENPSSLLFQHRRKMLDRTYTFYESTLVFLKLFFETNNYETVKAWSDSSIEKFNSHQYLVNQIEKEIRRWKKRTGKD